MPADFAPKKVEYFQKLTDLVTDHSKILIIAVDNISSKQMSEVRVALRGKGVILMGKNTMTRRALSKMLGENPGLSSLIGSVKLNTGFVFCKEEPSEVRAIIQANKFPEYAKTGVVAPNDVYVPPGPTGMDPGQTSFFQALGIATKIVKSQIEIQSTVHLVKEGQKVSPSAATLLQKLNIKPFTYAIQVKQVYEDGAVYDASFLDLSKQDITESFKRHLTALTAFGLAADMPSQATVSHTLIKNFKQLSAFAIKTDTSFPEIEELKKAISGKQKEEEED